MEQALLSDAAVTYHRQGHSLRGNVAERPGLFTVLDFQTFANDTGLNMIPVQQMTRYRQIHWPFYHQFMVITTVKIQPSALKPELFSFGKIMLGDLDPAINGISFRIDRGSRSRLGIEGSLELGSKADFDRIEIVPPGTKPLGGPEASDFEVTWRLTRKPDLDPTPFSLHVGDIGLFVQWISQINPNYDLFRNNCWILSSNISHLTFFHYFQHEFDLASQTQLTAMRVSHGLIRRQISSYFSEMHENLSHWIALGDRRRIGAVGEQESINSRTNIPFLSHPDRAGFGLLLSTCATSLKSPAGFAEQPDDVLFFICLRLLLLLDNWRTQIEEDPSVRDDFHRFIEEFSAIPLLRHLMALRPDIRMAYTMTMAYIYDPSLTSSGDHISSTLYTESIGKKFIPCISQYIGYLERRNFSGTDLQAIMLLVSQLVSFQDELEELIRLDILSVLAKVFRHKRHLTPQSRKDFEYLLFQFCSHSPTSRKHFLESDALFYIKDSLTREPQNPRLLGCLAPHIERESAVDLHNRLISCGVLVPLARCLTSKDSDDKNRFLVLVILNNAIDHNQGRHLLTRPILSCLARSLNHPFSLASFIMCGAIFRSLCALGDHAKKEVVNAGALPGLCRLARRDSYDADYEGTDHLLFENLLDDISQIDPSYAATVARARKQYDRGFKVQTIGSPKQTMLERARAIITR